LKDELSDSLARLKVPVLVVIDDIDRLSTDEIREVFQLVKANADFPNLIYLLLFQRNIVSDALDAISGNRGAEFLEKIVQVGFHVPQASRQEIQSVLFQRLDETLNLPGVSSRWERNRWSSLYQECLAGYFQNLRHVYRYLASFDFHVRQFQSGSGFEVNPVDLIALEALRIFEPEIYENLPSRKKILTSDEGRQLFGEIKQNTIDAAIEQILLHAPESRRIVIKRVLELVFPPITRSYEGRSGASRDAQDWLREARVCHPDLFDKYFTLVVARNDLSQADLERLVGMAGDADAFKKECNALQERGLIKIAFERLDAFKTEIPLESLPTLIRALCDISDGFAEPTPGFEFLPFDPLTIVFRIVYFGLCREKDKAKRYRVLRDAFEQSNGLLLPVDIVTLDERTKERDERQHEYLIDESHLPALKEICIQRLRQAAKSGALRSHPRASELLFR
jgi:predicted KAP-like P-loop ATPase